MATYGPGLTGRQKLVLWAVAKNTATQQIRVGSEVTAWELGVPVGTIVHETVTTYRNPIRRAVRRVLRRPDLALTMIYPDGTRQLVRDPQRLLQQQMQRRTQLQTS
jgi:hypothetical protein